jgi:hypothetical protein
LRAVRTTLERPDAVTASAVTAREEIGRAVAQKIREVEDARELKQVAEDVLPQIEKFLESYEEKRLRRVRIGIVTAASGLGFAIFMTLMSAYIAGADALFGVAGVGIAGFLVGIGLIINALWFTKPSNAIEDQSPAARSQNLLDAGYIPPQPQLMADSPKLRVQTTSNLAERGASSVTEHTTLNLNKK